MKKQIVISTLPEHNNDLCTFYPYESRRASQTLLGKNARIATFCSLLKQKDEHLLFCSRPELISSTKTRDFFSATHADSGGIDWQNVVHLRFDSARNTRLLKDAKNIVVGDTVNLRELLPLSVSARSIDVFPASVDRILTYDPGEGQQHPQNRLVPSKILSRAFLFADLCDIHKQKSISLAAIHDLIYRSDVRAYSIDELINQNAYGGQIDKHVYERSDFLREVIKHEGFINHARESSNRQSFILIPFNLEDDGSTVENLITTMISMFSSKLGFVNLCIAPYNINIMNQARLNKLISKCSGLDKSGYDLKNIFICFFQASAAFPIIKHLFKAIILDGADPDAFWSAKRLAEFTSRTIVLTNANNHSAWQEKMPANRTYNIDKQVYSEIDDRSGKRIVSSDSVTPRDVLSLLDLIADNDLDGSKVFDYGFSAEDYRDMSKYID